MLYVSACFKYTFLQFAASQGGKSLPHAEGIFLIHAFAPHTPPKGTWFNVSDSRLIGKHDYSVQEISHLANVRKQCKFRCHSEPTLNFSPYQLHTQRRAKAAAQVQKPIPAGLFCTLSSVTRDFRFERVGGQGWKLSCARKRKEDT